VARKTKPAPRPKRQRRTAEVAREQILDAAESRLERFGPGGIRLQEIAADIGISHPTILHHFGSREGLVEAVVMRALEGLQRRILEIVSDPQFLVGSRDDVVRAVIATLSDRGQARLMAFLALEGRPQDDPLKMLRRLAEMLHTRREAHSHEAPFDDTLFMVLLVALALFGEGVLGDAMFDSAGLGGERGARDRFHAWLVDLIDHHMRGKTKK
jgi:AcrR family transcriptional regulator